MLHDSDKTASDKTGAIQIQGEAQLGQYQSSPEVTRTFCKVCGSTMQFIATQACQDAFGLALGTVDDDPGCKPMRHVMVGSKAPWFICLSQRRRHPVSSFMCSNIAYK